MGLTRRSYPTAQARQAHLWSDFLGSDAVFEAPALVAGLDDFAVMREAVQ